MTRIDIQKGASAKAIAKAAGRDWEVALAPLHYRVQKNGKKASRTVDEHVLYRMDTLDHLTIVGSRYTPFQNVDVLAMFKSYLATMKLHICAVGPIFGGQSLWALASLNDSFTLKDGDTLGGYALLTVPQEYGKSAQIRFVSMGDIGGGSLVFAHGLRMHHMGKFDKDKATSSVSAEARTQIRVAVEEHKGFREIARRMVECKLPIESARSIMARCFLKGPARSVIALYEGQGVGAGLKSRQGTVWGLLQAALEHVDQHHGFDDNIRVHRALMGNGLTVKARVFAKLLRVSK